jgi:hypothetical protein
MMLLNLSCHRWEALSIGTLKMRSISLLTPRNLFIPGSQSQNFQMAIPGCSGYRGRLGIQGHF